MEGFFSHVWSVHPFVGADSTNDPLETGGLRTIDFAPGNTIVEAPAGRFSWLRRIPSLNFLFSQLVLLAFLLRLVKRERIGAIRVGDPYYLGLLGLLIARMNRIPLVIRVNGDYDAIYRSIGRLAYPRLFRWRWLEKRIDRFVLPRADLVGAANVKALNYALSNGARPNAASLFRYGNLIDPIHFAEPAERSSVRSELDIGDRPFVVCVSRLEPVKHPGDVIRALSVARQSMPDLCAVLIGDGAERLPLMNLTAALDLAASVRLVGNRGQSWIASCLADAHVVAAPMAGRALVESLLSGTPVVAYDIDWHAEVIEDATTGVLVPYRDVEQFGHAISRVAREASGRDIGARGRRAAMQMMDPAATAREERHLYECLFSRF